MTREEFQTERTRIISEMLDNPDEHGIYPTSKCHEELDLLYYKITAELLSRRDELFIQRNELLELCKVFGIKVKTKKYKS